MKSIERHQLKEDEFITTLQDTFARIDEHRRQVIWAVAALVVIAGTVGGVIWWRQDVNSKAAALLAEAQVVAEAPVVPPAPPAAAGTTTPPPAPTPGSYPTEHAKLEAALPKYLAAADAYPSSESGLAARYAAAGTLVALGRPAEAATRYQEVIDRAGSGLYGRMARLGLASVQAAQGKYDPAIATFKELAATSKDLPVDGILMQLARTYAAAGKKVEASQTYKRVTDEFPTSPYAADARKEIDALKGGS
jgi:TolA-binding protein